MLGLQVLIAAGRAWRLYIPRRLEHTVQDMSKALRKHLLSACKSAQFGTCAAQDA